MREFGESENFNAIFMCQEKILSNTVRFYLDF